MIHFCNFPIVECVTTKKKDTRRVFFVFKGRHEWRLHHALWRKGKCKYTSYFKLKDHLSVM